jgi:hypothetical protein
MVFSSELSRYSVLKAFLICTEHGKYLLIGLKHDANVGEDQCEEDIAMVLRL